MTPTWVTVKELSVDELLNLIKEEASEVIKAASKADRFGVWSNIEVIRQSKINKPAHTNLDDLRNEFWQLSELMIELSWRMHDYEEALEDHLMERVKTFKKKRLVLRD